MRPNGKPWSAKNYTASGFSNWIGADHVMASQMTSFGIPTHPATVSPYSAYLANLAAGNPMGLWDYQIWSQPSRRIQRGVRAKRG